ncbi:MAG TPA: hypothetical protein VMD30_00820 [Tepidisphaeraceae bacterium]|nr:hypothetical protein [Tepidisphaeraceae bacterium]
MNDPQHENQQSISPDLAAALDAMSGGQSSAASQAGGFAPVIGPVSGRSKRPTVAAPRRRPDPLFMQRTFIPLLLVLGIFLPALGVAQRVIDQDNPLSAGNLPRISILLLVMGAALLALGIVNVLSVRKKLRRSA